MNDNIDELRLTAISLLDGRNRDKMQSVSDYFSEYALIKYRIKVEISYLIFLSENTKILRKLSANEHKILENLYRYFTPKNAIFVKQIEKKINHDVKAVEYFIQENLKKTSLADVIPFIHFGLTSYDVNTPSYALMLSDFNKQVFVPQIEKILDKVKKLTISCKNDIMLGRTHGQPALPTTMGKELAVFYSRIKKEAARISSHLFEGKLTGAVGNFNALSFVCPEYDWISLSKKFIRSLGLTPNVVTTQIIPYDNWLVYFDSIKRLNNILLNMVQDIWWYISFEYFQQRKIEEEVGSSTMSHKINPITFENAEGNFQVANSLFEMFARKLSVSRLQRDLSDSTVKRDFGLAFGFTMLALDSISSGLGRISPNPEKMKKDLEEHWEIFAEGVQTYLRIKGQKDAFEVLKRETRGKTFTREEFHKLIDKLPIAKEDKKVLKITSLGEYRGLTQKIIDTALREK